MRSFFDDIGRGIHSLKAHPDFVALVLLALLLGIGRNPGIASAVSLRASLERRPAIEHFMLDVPVRLDDLRALKAPPCPERKLVFFRSY